MNKQREDSLDSRCRLISQVDPHFALRYARFLFQGVDFEGKELLDIGGGPGIYSFYAACSGARRAVCLEPGIEGSEEFWRRKFEKIASLLQAKNVTLCPARFQDYSSPHDAFDLIISHNSINHLDEASCVTMRESDESRRTYQFLFRKMYDLTRPGGKVVISECSHLNFFPMLGLRNPLGRDIEWEKHQPPRAWIELMRSVGFVEPSLRWEYPLRLSAIGRLLMSNRVIAFFHKSRFVFTMIKPA
ncbi:MAG: class I SAM-dependent methyltransferase [Candidatus Aureabacteria bacterium]|nr:class I SAM-dependent methyltransferase [Candidatus Auribacterota bacterium]